MSFKTLSEDKIPTYKYLLVKFTGKKCKPCRDCIPDLQEVADNKEFKHVTFRQINVSEGGEQEKLANKWHIESLPTFVFVKDGKIKDKISGANIPAVKKKIEQLFC